MPGHCLNQCWNIVNWTRGNKLQWNLNQNSNIFIQENAFENFVCEMASIWSLPQCVNSLCPSDGLWCHISLSALFQVMACSQIAKTLNLMSIGYRFHMKVLVCCVIDVDLGALLSDWAACSASNHFLNQCWLIVNYTLRKTAIQNLNDFVQENAFQVVIHKMSVILSRLPCVKPQQWCWQWLQGWF